jgi:hypothetical protein
MARLVKYQKNSHPRAPGYWKGKVNISKDFDQLPEKIAAAFRGEER